MAIARSPARSLAGTGHGPSEAGSVRTEILSEAQLAGLAPAWDALVERGDDPRPYSRHSWLTARRRHFGRGELVTVTAWRGDELAGAMPLEITRAHGITTAALVDGSRGGYGDLLVEAGDDEAAAALAGALHDVGADLLTIAMYREGSAAERALEPHGLRRMPSLDSLPRIRLDGSWPEVEQRLVSAQARKARRRRERRLEEQGAVQVSVLHHAEEIRPVLRDALRLHALRWPTGADGSGLGTPRGVAFFHDVCLALADEGLARVSVIRLDGQVIACQVAFLLAGQLALWRSQYDAAYRQYGVGLQVEFALFRQLSDDGERLEVIELGPGVESWKDELATERLVLPAGVVPLTARGRADAVRRLAMAHVRKRLKHVEVLQRVRAEARRRRDARTSR